MKKDGAEALHKKMLIREVEFLGFLIAFQLKNGKFHLKIQVF